MASVACIFCDGQADHGTALALVGIMAGMLACSAYRAARQLGRRLRSLRRPAPCDLIRVSDASPKRSTGSDASAKRR